MEKLDKHKSGEEVLVKFSRGLRRKVPDELLREVVEPEIERLKALLERHPHTGLFITDDMGIIVDLHGKNCKENLGWGAQYLIGKHLSSLTEKSYTGTEEVYLINRICYWGVLRRAEVVKGDVVLIDGKIYHVYLDTYFR